MNVVAPPDALNPDDRFKGMNPREVQRVVNAELLADLRWWRQSFTEFAARLQGRLVNDVLAVETCTFDASATPIQKFWRAAAGSIEVNNLSTHPITVSSAQASDHAPTGGVGVYVVPANSTRTVNLATRAVTFYGTAGDQFCYQAWTAGAAPGVV